MKPSANNCKQLMHANKVQADEIIQLREELIRYRREWQRECEQTDLLLQGLGLCPSEYRSEGGSLLVGRIAHKLKRNCARCNDTGLVFDERTITQRRPCPDCTDLRRLLGEAGHRCDAPGCDHWERHGRACETCAARREP